MSYTEKDYRNYVDKLNNIREMDWVKFQLDLNKQPNFWSILEYGTSIRKDKRSSHEERLSKMIRWLLDPNETHQLGNIFAVRFLELINKEYDYHSSQNKQIKVETEYENIDILYRDYDKNMFLAIELKQYSAEGIQEIEQLEGEAQKKKSQLDNYDETLYRLASDDTHIARIFLTPTGFKPTNEKWEAISYKSFIQIIDDVLANECKETVSIYQEKTKQIIDDFKDELQRIVYIKERDPRDLRNKLLQEERNLTIELAKEITGEIQYNRMNKLIEKYDGETKDLENLILFIRNFIYTQDHSKNEESQILMLKIYNYLTDGDELSLDLTEGLSKKERTSILNQDLFDTKQLKSVELELTSKGQGIHIRPDNGKYRIYMSSNGEGYFPGIIHVVDLQTGHDLGSDHLPNRRYKLKDELIMDDQIMDRDHKRYHLEDVILQDIIPAIIELDQIGQRGIERK